MEIDTSDYYPYTPGASCDSESVGSEASETEIVAVSNPVGPEGIAAASEGVEERATPLRGGKDPEGEAWERVCDRIGNVLSWVLVPLLMPLYALIICFRLSMLQFATDATKLGFCCIIFVITCLIPMLLVVILKKMGLVQDLGLNGRKERFIPYLISIFSLAVSGWFMLSKGAPVWTGMFFFGGALAGLVNMIVNLKWKISAHAAGMAGIVALLVCISREPLPHPHIEVWVAVAIALAGLLAAARVWLGRHTVMQVLAGSAVGFLCVFFLTLI